MTRRTAGVICMVLGGALLLGAAGLLSDGKPDVIEDPLERFLIQRLEFERDLPADVGGRSVRVKAEKIVDADAEVDGDLVELIARGKLGGLLPLAEQAAGKSEVARHPGGGLFLLLEQAGDAGDEGGHIDLGKGVLIRGMMHGKASF